MGIGDKIKKRRIEIGLSQEELAKKTGYTSRSSINKIELGINDITQSKVIIFADVLHTTPAYLMDWDDNITEPVNNANQFIRLPLYQSISCGNGGFVEDNILEYITIPDKMLRKGKEYFACYAEGNSMIDENIQSGDLIIFEKTININNGDIGCFCIDDNQATCKRFRKDTRTGMIMLLPANNDYEPIMVTLENQNFRVVGKLALVINDRQR